MTYQEACDRLTATSGLGSKPGLETIKHLCSLIGDPQDQLSIVHVAGTNGKGSTCTMIAAILQAAGYHTGLYLSPHIAGYRDSVYVNRHMISKDDFADVVSSVCKQADVMAAQGIYATGFEILTVCAFLWFNKNKCDAVVLETGMGGRLDATNIIKNPLVSVLTAISFDHTAFLGETIERITYEKCGIIKPGGITVSYPEQDKAVLSAIQKAVKEKENRFIVPDTAQLETVSFGIDGACFIYRGLNAQINLGGKHQVLNAVTAIETVTALQSYHGFAVCDAAVIQGLHDTYLPARQEVLSVKPLILLDGAHNLQGILALADTISSRIANRPLVAIMGMLSDKQYERSVAVMAALCDRFIAVVPDNPRAMDASIIARIAQRYCGSVEAADNAEDALEDALSYAGQNGAVVICGSLYMANRMRNEIKKILN